LKYKTESKCQSPFHDPTYADQSKNPSRIKNFPFHKRVIIS